jgi:hypothetical protein
LCLYRMNRVRGFRVVIFDLISLQPEFKAKNVVNLNLNLLPFPTPELAEKEQRDKEGANPKILLIKPTSSTFRVFCLDRNRDSGRLINQSFSL